MKVAEEGNELKSSRYLDEFIRLRCAPDLLCRYLYPNAKEITESMAAFNAYRKYFNFNDDIVAAVIGDGCTLCTAALFAMRTRGQIFSIDPRVQEISGIDRLIIKKDKGEAFKDYQFDILILVHAHIRLSELENMSSNLICMPCCVKQDWFRGRQADIEYQDFGVWSPQRTIKIWKGKN